MWQALEFYPVSFIVGTVAWFLSGFLVSGRFWAYTLRHWSIPANGGDMMIAALLCISGAFAIFSWLMVAGIHTIVGEKNYGWLCPFSEERNV